MAHPHLRPATRAGATPALAEDRFQFHPRATNPELWRTTQPLIVHERCRGHKGLIATWMAIHWLIVLHAAAGRRDFGVREIASRACVGRNELTGPQGYIQRLVDLGLLQIVGYDDRGGQFRAPRPIYHLDLWELERLSLEIVPEVLRVQGVAPPPRPAPDPRQTSFLDALGETHDVGTALDQHEHAVAPTSPSRQGAAVPVLHENGTEVWQSRASSAIATHESGTVPQPAGPKRGYPAHGNGTGLHHIVTGSSDSTWGTHENRTGLHENGTVYTSIVPALAQKRDVEGEKERENERGSDHTHTRELLQELAAQAAQVVLQALQQEGVISTTRATKEAPTGPSEAPPADEPPLPDRLIALWQGDRGAIGARDRHQLQMLAAEYDGATGGHGAYWVGRAILIADRCLAERGQALSVNYLRAMLRRWQREGRWGSDLESEAGELPASALSTPRPQAAVVAPAADGQESGTSAAPTPIAPDPSAPAQPAVAAYIAAFNRTPNAVQAEQIVGTVTDLAAWRQVLTDWQAHGWKEGAVANMLDRYRKEAGSPADDGPAVSVTVIHRYPGLSDQQRDRWITRFHAALTPAEKRAVLNRLEQEHPR